jgi:hypothetical protein
LSHPASDKAAQETQHSSGSDSNNPDTDYSSDSDVTSKRKSAEVRKSDRQTAVSKHPIVISSSEDSPSVRESGSEVEVPSEGDASSDDAESDESEVRVLQPRKRVLKARSQPARKSSKVAAKPAAAAAAAKKPKQRRKSSEASLSADSSFEIDHGDGDPTRIEVLIAHFVRQSPTDPFPDFMPRAKTASESESSSAVAAKNAHPKESVNENTIFYLIKYQRTFFDFVFLCFDLVSSIFSIYSFRAIVSALQMDVAGRGEKRRRFSIVSKVRADFGFD